MILKAFLQKVAIQRSGIRFILSVFCVLKLQLLLHKLKRSEWVSQKTAIVEGHTKE